MKADQKHKLFEDYDENVYSITEGIDEITRDSMIKYGTYIIEEVGGIAKLLFGKEFQQDVLDPVNKNLSKETEAFNVLKESLGEAFELWTLGAQTAKEAGAALREEVLVPIYIAAKAIKDQGYAQLAQRAGGGNKMYDPRSLMEEVTK